MHYRRQLLLFFVIIIFHANMNPLHPSSLHQHLPFNRQSIMNLSTSFKYICTAMALLASPSAAQSGPSIVFVTSTTHTGALGGLSGADAICQGIANGAPLPGTYKAWLSDSTGTPDTRFYKSPGIYRNVNGFTVADNWDDLIDGAISNLNLDQFGNQFTGTVWTNTNVDGTRSGDWDCNDWTSSSDLVTGREGYINRVDGSWTYSSGGYRGCGYSSRLYCFQQIGVPTVSASSLLVVYSLSTSLNP